MVHSLSEVSAGGKPKLLDQVRRLRLGAPKFLFHLISLIKLLLRCQKLTHPESFRGWKNKTNAQKEEEASPKLTLNPNLSNQ